MPPFPASGPIGKYIDDPRLSDGEIESIKRWVDAGARLGNPDNLAQLQEHSWPEWPLGEPDILIDLPKIRIRQDGKDDNLVAYSSYVFPDDLWIEGIDVKPGNYSALHHANLMLAPPDEEVPKRLVTRKSMGADILTYQLLLGWLPGYTPQRMPAGEAILVPKGTRLLWHAHYAPTTEAITDQSRVGIYLANGVINRHARQGLSAIVRDIEIPPHEGHYEVKRRAVFEEDGLVRHFRFHMHVRGKATRAVFHYPNGVTETVIDIPKWDFHWQRHYYLAEPIFAPKGTKVEFVAIWDNSENNADNPNPKATVYWGGRTIDEMYGANIYYSRVDIDEDDNIRVLNGREIAPAEIPELSAGR